MSGTLRPLRVPTHLIERAEARLSHEAAGRVCMSLVLGRRRHDAPPFTGRAGGGGDLAGYVPRDRVSISAELGRTRAMRVHARG